MTRNSSIYSATVPTVISKGGVEEPRVLFTPECEAGLAVLNAADLNHSGEVDSIFAATETIATSRDGVDITVPFFKDLLANSPVEGADAIRSLADWSGGVRPNNSAKKVASLVYRGKHGLVLAHAWATHYASLIEGEAERALVRLRVRALVALIKAVSAKGFAAKKNASRSGNDFNGEGDDDMDMTEEPQEPKKRKKADSNKPGTTGKKFKKAKNNDAADDVEEEPDDGKEDSSKKRKRTEKKSAAKPKKKPKTISDKTAGKAKAAVATTASKDASDTSSSEGSDIDSDSSSEEESAEQRASVKLTWALSQYCGPKKAGRGKELLWKFTCRYCPGPLGRLKRRRVDVRGVDAETFGPHGEQRLRDGGRRADNFRKFGNGIWMVRYLQNSTAILIYGTNQAQWRLTMAHSPWLTYPGVRLVEAREGA
ncbi:hypothetical protein K438DRAFT_1759304 [Mycena galopus ATCC 62051]|nr:hypothetical protein K438DRAFT_1759304 [Mycena galopus ATCC 62051]